MLLACARTVLPDDSPAWQVPGQSLPQPAAVLPTNQTILLPPTRAPGDPILTPTPDIPHPLPTLRTEPSQYVVQPGDTLGTIAQRYGVSLETIVEANTLVNPNLLDVGQNLVIPVPTPFGVAPAFKVIPDSELVYGPASAEFDITGFIQSKGGYLAGHREEVNEKQMTGAQIVERVAQDYSVNPRLLLAALEYQSGWVTQTKPDESTLKFPMGVRDEWRDSLYRQLAWAANQLNQGYYLWRVNAVATWLLGDGSVVPVDATINPGTAGVQQLFAPLYDRQGWENAVTAGGLFATYSALFGYPFDYAVEPILPGGLRQPVMQLPFEAGKPWAFTGGPHGGWDAGSAWAALDFAPPSNALGCITSNEWVTAITDGTILRADHGAVIQDLDNDGREQTGWAVLYMHIETRDRVQPGTFLKAGDRIGHPSCEGGLASGTHVHLARKYNGEWIPADQQLPFILDGWVSRGTGEVYDGFMEREGTQVEAYEGRSADNIIQR
jgi:murein DD-endopeptidase MepM/ murein hydrolase activator NlpD